MQSMLVTLMFLLMILSPSISLDRTTNDEEKMTAEERAKTLTWLRDSQKQTLDAVEGLSDEQWNFKPAPGKWSVGEVVEHIYLAEGLIFKQVEAAMAAPFNPNWKEKTKGKSEFIERVMVNRTGKAQAPEQIVPVGKLTRSELMEKLKSARAATIKFAEQTEAPLKSHTSEHPFPVFNTLSAYNWLIYIPLHNIRHNQQIDEVKASPNFPKK